MGFLIRHLDHDFVALGEATPEELQYSLMLAEPHTVQYKLKSENTLAVYPNVCAYETDFLLQRDSDDFLVGMHTGVNVDEAEELLSIAGKDYKHYLERRQFPFDPTDPTLYLFEKPATDIFTVVEDILTVVLAETYSLPMSYANGLAGTTIDYRIDPADTENIYEKINSLAEGHFDWLVDVSRWVRLYAPNKGTVNSYVFEKGRNLITLPYEDTGPDGNHVLGLGAGTANKLGSVYNNVTGQQLHRRLDSSHDFGSDVIDQSRLNDLTNAEGARTIKHKLKIEAEVVPDYIDEVLDEVALGDTCRFIGSNFHKDIDQNFRIVGFQGTDSKNGAETLTLVIEEE